MHACNLVLKPGWTEVDEGPTLTLTLNPNPNPNP